MFVPCVVVFTALNVAREKKRLKMDYDKCIKSIFCFIWTVTFAGTFNIHKIINHLKSMPHFLYTVLALNICMYITFKDHVLSAKYIK